jgi:hypothetical protein
MDLYGKCGNNCGRCALYADNLTAAKRQWCAEGMGKYINWHPNPDRLRLCTGCQATDGFKYLQNCAVRKCAQYNGVENCAHCAVFPCRHVPTVSLSVGYRDQVAARLGGPIPKQDYRAFIEPYEGIKHLEAIRASLDPTAFAEPAAVRPLKTRLVDFPDGLPLAYTETAAYRALHRLLADILSARAELYVQQMVLKQRRPVIWNLLWVFGRHAKVVDGDAPHLVIDSETFGSLPEVKGIVRKRDNALHGTAAIAAELLQGFGVQIAHIPLTRESWQLEMAFVDRAAGAAGLKALKGYVTRLVEKHGAPTYTGSSRYHGETFSRFSKVDMRSLGGP